MPSTATMLLLLVPVTVVTPEVDEVVSTTVDGLIALGIAYCVVAAILFASAESHVPTPAYQPAEFN